MARALILDLDDTLYDERNYVLSGFRVVAAEIANRFPSAEAEQLWTGMVAELDTHGRGKVFDRALAQAGASPDPGLIAELVQAYRDHRPTITLWPGVQEALRDLARDHRLAVVTDGLHLMQQRKIEALGVRDLVETVLYCWEHQAPKPDPTCYVEALRRLDVGPKEAVLIGDNPAHDMAAAWAIGCRSIRVRTGRFADQDDAGVPPDATVASFPEAADLVRDAQFGAHT